MTNSISLKAKEMMILGLGMLSAIAMFVAQTSSSTCVVGAFEQPKVPKQLINKD